MMSLLSGRLFGEFSRCRVVADGAEGFLAEIVFDFAGIFFGDCAVYSESHEKFGKDLVATVHLLGDFHSRFGQGDETVFVHGNIAIFPQAFGGITDAGLGHAQVFGNVDGADVTVALLEHQHGFQIIF